MKHIFLIHSHTLYLTAVGTIEFLKIEDKDVIFVYSRNYKTILKNNFLTVDMSKEAEDCFHSVLSFSRKNYFVNHALKDSIIKEVDAFVESQVTDSFKVYVPHLQSFISQIFATNERCVECNYLQEGGRVMNEFLTDRNLLFFKIYNKLFLRNEHRLWKCICWFPPKDANFRKPINTFVINKMFFGKWNKPQFIIKWPSIHISEKIDATNPIFVYEGAVELGQIEESVYMNEIKKQIEQYAEKNNYVKFHPIQKEEAKEKIKNFFYDKDVNVTELPMDMPFELILTSYKNLNIFGFGTSLLFFAKPLGHTVVSNEKNLLVSAKYRQYFKRIAEL